MNTLVLIQTRKETADSASPNDLKMSANAKICTFTYMRERGNKRKGDQCTSEALPGMTFCRNHKNEISRRNTRAEEQDIAASVQMVCDVNQDLQTQMNILLSFQYVPNVELSAEDMVKVANFCEEIRRMIAPTIESVCQVAFGGGNDLSAFQLRLLRILHWRWGALSTGPDLAIRTALLDAMCRESASK